MLSQLVSKLDSQLVRQLVRQLIKQLVNQQIGQLVRKLVKWGSVAILAQAIGAQGVRPNSALQFAASDGMTQSFASTTIYLTPSQYDAIFKQFNFDFAGAGCATQTRPPTHPTNTP